MAWQLAPVSKARARKNHITCPRCGFSSTFSHNQWCYSWHAPLPQVQHQRDHTPPVMAPIGAHPDRTPPRHPVTAPTVRGGRGRASTVGMQSPSLFDAEAGVASPMHHQQLHHHQQQARRERRGENNDNEEEWAQQQEGPRKASGSIGFKNFSFVGAAENGTSNCDESLSSSTVSTAAAAVSDTGGGGGEGIIELQNYSLPRTSSSASATSSTGRHSRRNTSPCMHDIQLVHALADNEFVCKNT